MFITLEGPEGSGKTTQIVKLAQFLEEQGHNVIRTREPGGTRIGDQIRATLLALENTEMHPRTEALLLQASRAQLVEEIIIPRLAKGEIVLCDRYADSTLAYQGYGHQHDLEPLRKIVQYATGGLKPDLTILLDLAVEEGLSRRHEAGDINRLDALDLDFHRRVREGYLELAKEEPERWVVVNADQPFEVIQREIRELVSRKISPRFGGNHPDTSPK
ncbi:MAG: Thymidylate kinase [Chloroflexi bacterium]|nr:Thymidylate kinase [Chloroflexota bacterium]